MRDPFNIASFRTKLFSSKLTNLNELALDLFEFQVRENPVFNKYHQLVAGNTQPKSLEELTFLPISQFKSKQVITGNFIPEILFTSSATTGSIPSTHYVADLSIYRESFTKAFQLFYGNPKDYAIVALLPSYLDRAGSSLVFMTDTIIKESGNSSSGFYLTDFEALDQTLLHLQSIGQKTIILGVTFALLDFGANFKRTFPELIVMETGGMKGRKEEITRNEVHELLKRYFGVEHIHAEYGMTELLSQAYSKGNGIYTCPPWMKILISDPTDPFTFFPPGKRGVINIIDLANINSCAFIQTEDTGVVNEDGSFLVSGRLDQSEIRGCSLLYV